MSTCPLRRYPGTLGKDLICIDLCSMLASSQHVDILIASCMPSLWYIACMQQLVHNTAAKRRTLFQAKMSVVFIKGRNRYHTKQLDI